MCVTASPHEQHLARFTANPDDRVAFEYLEEHLFMQSDWTALADLYRRRCAAPSLQNHARQRAELFMRLAQVCEDRLEDADAAIAAYSEAVALEPRLRRALRQLRSLFQVRGSWEAVLQISEQEAALAGSREERARAYVEMADVWRRHLGDPEQAEMFYARARLEGWSDARAAKPADARVSRPAPAPAPTTPAPAAAPAPPAPRVEVRIAAPPRPSVADEFQFYDNLEVDLEVDGSDDAAVFEDEAAPEAPAILTMPEFDDEPASRAQPSEGERRSRGEGEQRSVRVLGVLERKLATRESRGVGLDAESLHLRLRIAELRAGVQADPVAAIAVLEPALASPSALCEVAPMLAGLYEQLGRIEPLIALAERAASVSEPREQRTHWIRRAAEAARAVGDPERAITAYQRLLAELPADRGARAALGDLYRSRGNAAPLAELLREELPRADRDRELELQLELASLAAESLGDPVGAVPHLRRCLELEPARADLLEWALSACALRGGPLAQLDLVEHVCERAENDTARAALLARRGALLADALSWREEASQSWRAALLVDPNQALARERLAAL
jgi:cellulose synthase operon protein C